jgi:hypothetical protein
MSLSRFTHQDTILQDSLGFGKKRVNTLFAGEILVLIVAFLIAINLLFVDHAHTVSQNPEKLDRKAVRVVDLVVVPLLLILLVSAWTRVAAVLRPRPIQGHAAGIQMHI